MDLREAISKKPGAGVGIAIVLIAVAVIFIYRQMKPEPPADTRLYFSDDDGKSWFREDRSHIPPFDHNGKEAVRCFMFEADGQTFIGYLRKYTPSFRAKVANNAATTAAEAMSGTLVKKPGDAQWVPVGDPKSAQILNPKDPNNPNADATSLDD